MEGINARPRVIRGTRTAPLPLLPSGPGGVCSRPLHGARDPTSIYRIMRGKQHCPVTDTGRDRAAGEALPNRCTVVGLNRTFGERSPGLRTIKTSMPFQEVVEAQGH